VFIYYYACLLLCLLLVCLVRENFSGGPGHIFSCVGFRCVECRAGTILFGHFLGADGGTVQIFPFSWFCCSGYGTVEMVRGVVHLFLAFFCCQFSWRLDVCGRIFVLYNLIFFGRFVVFSRGFVFCKLLIFLIYYRWFRRSQNLEDQEPLLERTRLEHQKADLETRIEHLEADVLYLRSVYVFLEDGEKKDAIFSTICGLDSEISQLKAELAAVNSLLSSY
jgi:hypothetical protein